MSSFKFLVKKYGYSCVCYKEENQKKTLIRQRILVDGVKSAFLEHQYICKRNSGGWQ